MGVRETLARFFAVGPDYRGATTMERRAGLPLYPDYTIGRPSWPTRSVATNIERFYALNATIYACIIARALSVSVAPLRVYREEGKESNPQEEHVARQLIRRPNPQMSEAEFWTLVSVIADVTNLCVIEKERSRDGGVIGLWPLRTDWLTAIPRNNAPPDWEYHVGSDTYLLKAEDVIVYSPAPSVTQSPHGAGPMSVIFREATISNAMTDFVKVLFERGGMPQHILIPRANPTTGRVDLNEAQADTLREKWRQRFAGADGMADIAVAVGIEDVKRIGFNLNEMAYVDLRDVTELDICKAFGVPPGLIGVKAGLERNTFTNFAESRSDFYERTISGLWARLDGAFTRGLLPEFSDDPRDSFEFDTSEVAALQDDIGPARTWALAAFQGGLISRHVAQREAQVEEHGRDAFLLPFSVIESPVAALNGNGRAQIIVEASSRRVAERKALPSGIHRLPTETRARAAQSAKQAIARVGDAHAPAVRRFFEGQADRVVEKAKRSTVWRDIETAKADLGDLWDVHTLFGEIPAEQRAVADIDWSQEDALLDEVLRQLNIHAGETATAATAELTGIGISWDLAHPWVQRVLDQLASRVVGINQTTRADIQRIIGEAVLEGTSPDDLANRLRGLFDETYKNRALTVARTESQVAYNTASTLGYRESGVVDMAELADNGSHTEGYGASDGLSCAQRDGLIVPLDRVELHIEAEHPNGSLAVLPVLSKPLGVV